MAQQSGSKNMQSFCDLAVFLGSMFLDFHLLQLINYGFWLGIIVNPSQIYSVKQIMLKKPLVNPALSYGLTMVCCLRP